MSAKLKPQLTHMAIFVTDLAKMQEFYTRVFGLTVTDEGPHPMAPVDMLFMSASPTEHHQFVLVTGRPENVEFNIAQQMSFLIQSLGELREMRDRVTAAGIEVKRACTHGNAWSIYFDDPEGNQIEVYVHSPWYIPQPHVHPIDLDASDEELMRLTEAHCRESTGFMPRAEREAKMREMMGLA
jgi:catechol 2,3-dioxygenase